MATAHAGMAITDAQFNALVEDLLLALDELGVPYALDGSQVIDPLLLALVGMQADIVTDPDGSSVYFNQLGGHGAITAVIDLFLARVVTDARINGRFADAIARDGGADLRAKLIDQVCQATGGYCTYTGADMVTAHAGMCISSAEFYWMAEDLLGALDDAGVPYSDFFTGSELGDLLVQTIVAMEEDVTEECPPT
jgi:hemoglobin